MVYQLIGLDLRLIKSYMKSMWVLIFVVGPLFSLVVKNTDMMVMYICLSAIMALGYPFAVAESKKADLLYDVLPISKKQVVMGRYLYVIIVCAVAIAFVLALNPIMTLIIGQPVDFVSLLNGVALLAAGLFVGAAYQLPLFFKLGFTKARIWGYAPFIGIGASGMLLSQVTELDLSWMFNIPPVFYLPVACVLLAVSYFISCKIYK
jgi:hypothetical protein